MKRLLLIRHAKSSWDDPALADHERPLAPRGQKAAERIAEHLGASDASIDLVLCSSSRRTRETLERLSGAFGEAEVRVEDGLYGASAGDLLDRLHEVPEAVGGVAVIGHNPGIQDLTIELARDGRHVGRALKKFPTAAVAVLEFDAPWSGLANGNARLVDFTVPKDLE
ncbi:MAG TPA: histidine phosphatase family protein [Actinomycetota bacterium]|nr:histidine phosphatase family protein [Actinomycetota bacterium]